jgi:acyl-CoA hydrolase
MEVRVDTYVEKLSGERTPINRAYLTLVALDEAMRPARVPGLILLTPEERAEWDAGLARKAQRALRMGR